MGDVTGIAWCDSTWNPWIGCTEVSRACDFCYARTLSERYGWTKWGNNPRHRTAPSTWAKPLAWERQAARTGIGRKIFPSLCDPFDNQVDPGWRAEFWDLIRSTSHLTWLLLTKRPQNVAKMAPALGLPRNVWIGMTAEDQTEFDRRWPALAAVPASVHFVSYEPALGPLRLGAHRPDWVIFGGESGPHKRAVDLDWGRALRDECAATGVAYFGKQWDGVRPLPDDLMVRQFPSPNRPAGAR